MKGLPYPLIFIEIGIGIGIEKMENEKIDPDFEYLSYSVYRFPLNNANRPRP